ncbi:PDZ domain-containing protein 8 [Dinochytrium kinnereticum]|nr:PDZ domain-containing protein 8 [Dinochytrium kinnereticum]
MDVFGNAATAAYIRGAFAGIGFLIILEVFIILVACFFLFDPMRKTVTPPKPEYAIEENASDALKFEASGIPKPGGTFLGSSSLRATDKTNEHEEPWPANIIGYLKASLTPTPEDTMLPPPPLNAKKKFNEVLGEDGKPLLLDPVAMGPTQVCEWVNVVAHRFFLSLRDSQLFKDRMRQRTTERMNMKLKNNSFVSHVNIMDLSLGDHAPKIHGIRLMKGVTDDLAVLLEVDVTYLGGGSIAIETTLTAGLSIPVRVYISGFSGKLRVRIPSVYWPDMLAVAFVEDPGISFVVDSPLTLRENELVRVSFPTNETVSSTADFSDLESKLSKPFLAIAVDKRKESEFAVFAEPSEYQLPDNAEFRGFLSSLMWKTAKNRGGVCVQKSKVAYGGRSGDISRAFISINCDAERVFAHSKEILSLFKVLSNPEHFRHIEDTYTDSFVVKGLDDTRSVRHMSFSLSRSSKKDLNLFEVKKKIIKAADGGEGETKPVCEAYIVTMRSIGSLNETLSALDLSLKGPDDGITQNTSGLSEDAKTAQPHPISRERVATESTSKPDVKKGSDNVAAEDLLQEIPASDSSVPEKPPNEADSARFSTVYLYGYLIEACPEDSSSTIVTVISQMAPELSKLEANFNACRKIKLFIEELVSLTYGGAANQSGNELRRRRIFSSGTGLSATSTESTGEKRIEKIRNLVSSTTSYLMKSKRVANWLGSGTLNGNERNPETSSIADAQSINTAEIEEFAETLAQVEMARLDELEAAEANLGGELDNHDEGFEAHSNAPIQRSLAFDRLDIADDTLSTQSIDLDEGRQSSVGLHAPPIPSIHPSPSIISGISGMVPSTLKASAASAVAIARSVAKRRSFKFLKRGNQTGETSLTASDDDEANAQHDNGAEINGMDVSFAVGTNLGDVPWVEKRMFGKGEIVRADMPTLGSGERLELAWEFFVKGEATIVFGLLFTPSSPTSLPFPESSNEPGTRQIIPMASVNGASPRGFRGSLSTSSFPEGLFTFVWDNSNGNKKQFKDILHRFTLRAFEIPKSPSLSSSAIMREHVGEFGLGTDTRGFCTGVSGEVIIQRKAVYRVSVVYDSSMDPAESEDGCSGITYLTWDYSTNGLDVNFGINYSCFVDSVVEVKSIADQRSHSASIEALNASEGIVRDSASEIAATSDMVALLSSPSISCTPPLPQVPISAMGSSPPKSERPSVPPPKPTRRGQKSPRGGSPQSERGSLASRLAATVAAHEQTPAASLVSDDFANTDLSGSLDVLGSATQMSTSPGIERTHSQTMGSIGGLSESLRKHSRAEVIIPSARVSSHRGSSLSGVIPISGRHGVYSFVWDNSHSVVLHKTIAFRVGTVTHPELSLGAEVAAEVSPQNSLE